MSTAEQTKRIDALLGGREPGEEPVEERPALKVWMYEVPREAYPFQAPADGTEPGFVKQMPKGARLLCVTRSNENQGAVLFALVNPLMEEEPRFFFVKKTNEAIPSPGKVKVGKEVQDWSGASLVWVGSWEGFRKWWHLFEVVNAKVEATR
jgi:hypothetical protein